MKPDFVGLSALLLPRARDLLVDWLPGGRVEGQEYVCANLNGGRGHSCKFNLQTGLWADFSGEERGGDLVALYAAIQRIDMKEAYLQLSEKFRFNGFAVLKLPPAVAQQIQIPYTPTPTAPATDAKEKPRLIPPPLDAAPPVSLDRGSLSPTKVWEYKNTKSRILFYIARYDTNEGKEFRPWSYSSDGKWITKAWPENRPLYGLETLTDKRVLVVEGEKAADAARRLTTLYEVVTWMSGSKAVAKTDWRPLHGRKILLWPDADKPGIDAMKQITELLYPHCPEIKCVGVEDMPEGWDAADAVSEGWDTAKFMEWARPRVYFLKPIAVKTTPLDAPLPPAPVPDKKSLDIDLTLRADLPPINANQNALWIDVKLILSDRSKQPVVQIENVLKIMHYFPGFKNSIWYDEFHNKVFTTLHTDGTPHEWRDSDETLLAAYFQREIGFPKITEAMVRSCALAFAEKNVRNEPRDWMDSLSWDGVPRIDDFLTNCMGASLSEYAAGASKNFWISMVARVFSPGCKCDNMVVLEGKQGKRKSTALDVIAGKWFSETSESPTNKDFFLAIQGRLIVEIAELDSFSKAETNTIKRVLSCRVDRFRPPFGKYTRDFGRQGIFCGSTNEDEYLEDATGGRRFWPVKTGEINIDRIRTEREQLFAEAVHRFKAGESWWEMPASTADEQEKRRHADSWEGTLYEHLKHQHCVKMTEVAKIALKIEDADLTRAVQIRIAKIFKLLGFRKNVIREGTAILRTWVRDLDE